MEAFSQSSYITIGLTTTLIAGSVTVTAFVWKFFGKIQSVESETSANIKALDGRVTHLEATVGNMFKDVIDQKSAIAVINSEIKNMKELLEKIDNKIDSLIGR